MIESTELKVLPDQPPPSNYTRMKGTTLRNGHSRLMHPSPTPSTPQHVNASLQLPQSKPHPHPNRQSPDNKLTKTMSIMGSKDLSEGVRARQRVVTPIAAKNYRRGHSSQQNVSEPTSQPAQDLEPPSNRYPTKAERDINPEFRLSLSTFQDGNKNSPQIKNKVKTQQQLIGLKLEGTQCRIAEGFSKGRPTKGQATRKQSCQLVHNWYITQQGSNVVLSEGNRGKDDCQHFKNIIQKIKVEDDRPEDATPYLNKIDSVKKLKGVGGGGFSPRNRLQHRNSARAREPAHLNVINIQERPLMPSPHTQPHPYHKLYARIVKHQLQNNQQIPSSSRTIELQQKQLPVPQELAEEMASFKKELQRRVRSVSRKSSANSKRGAKQSGVSELKLVPACQQNKLQQRKSLMKNYTFKKIAVPVRGGQRVLGLQDFHVQGWNHSTEFQKKETIMIV